MYVKTSIHIVTLKKSIAALVFIRPAHSPL